MICYLSGKISGLTEKEYTKNFKDAAHEIWVKYPDLYYVNIVNPIKIKPFLGIKKYWFYMAKDIYYLKKCSHIALMSNWKESKGACIEHFIGKFIFKLDVIYL